jgi:2-dehydropantoate 2-reductase
VVDPGGHIDSNPSALRFLVYGAGAIGTYIGGSLALTGHSVVFLERKESIPVLRERGIHLCMRGKDYSVSRPEIAETLAEALNTGRFDCAVFAIKAYDTPSVLQELEKYRDSLPVFLCLQNGVQNEAVLGEVLGAGRVIAGTVTSAIGRNGPGDIVLERFRGMAVAGENPLSPALADAFQSAGLNVRVYENPDSLKWSKMATNLVGNASSAILNMTLVEIFADPRLFRLEIAQLREVFQVMQAKGIPIVDLPGAPVRLLAWSARNLPYALAHPLLTRFLVGSRGAKRPSFYLDLHSGRRKSEVDYLNGAVARFGAMLGIPVPVNRGLNETLLALTDGSIDASTFDHKPEKLLAKLAAAQ